VPISSTFGGRRRRDRAASPARQHRGGCARWPVQGRGIHRTLTSASGDPAIGGRRHDW